MSGLRNCVLITIMGLRVSRDIEKKRQRWIRKI